MGNCNEFCTHDTQATQSLPEHTAKSMPSQNPRTLLQNHSNTLSQHNPKSLPQHTSASLSEQTPTTRIVSQIPEQNVLLRCEICDQQKKHTKLKSHLDLCHFTLVREDSSTGIQVVCLLCGFKAGSLENQKNHIKNAHPYMEETTKSNYSRESNGQAIESNQKLKKRVKMVARQDYQEKWDSKTTTIDGKKYGVQTYIQEYGAMDFDEDRAAGDLVWRHVFARLREISFYNIEYEAKPRTILATAKIFTPKNS